MNDSKTSPSSDRSGRPTRSQSTGLACTSTPSRDQTPTPIGAASKTALTRETWRARVSVALVSRVGNTTPLDRSPELVISAPASPT